MARLALPAQYPAVVLGSVVMTTKTVRQRTLVQHGPLRMLGLPGLIVRRHVPAGNHDGITFDRPFMDDRRMTGRTTFALPAPTERLHMFAMAHDQPHILHRCRQIPRRDFRHAEDIAMAPETDG